MKEKIVREDINRTESVSDNNTQTTPTRRHGEEYKKQRVLPLCLRLGELTKHTRKKAEAREAEKSGGGKGKQRVAGEGRDKHISGSDIFSCNENVLPVLTAADKAAARHGRVIYKHNKMLLPSPQIVMSQRCDRLRLCW